MLKTVLDVEIVESIWVVDLLFSLVENDYENCDIHLEKAELNKDLIQKINNQRINLN